MRFIEITSRFKKHEMMSYNELNAWLNKKAKHAIVACYYRSTRDHVTHYEFIDGHNVVPQTYRGMKLEKVVL